jgi:hypothetical protein
VLRAIRRRPVGTLELYRREKITWKDAQAVLPERKYVIGPLEREWQKSASEARERTASEH